MKNEIVFYFAAACIGSVLFVLIMIDLFLIVRLKNYKLKETELNAKLKLAETLGKHEVELIQNSIKAQEVERNRISKELHDSVGSMLTLIKWNMSELGKEVSEKIQEKEQAFKQIDTKLDETILEIRRLSHKLVSKPSDTINLTHSINELVQLFENAKHSAITFQHQGMDAELPQLLQIDVYRIVQEMLQNSLKHAKAKTIDLYIIVEKGELRLSYEDSGIGYDPNSIVINNGLENIQERINNHGGVFVDDSQAGVGVNYSISFKLVKKK